MPKFSVGQTVYHRSGKHSGKVVACEDDTVYFILPNGVEMDFRSDELTTSPPAGKSPAVAEGTTPARLLTEADITPEHRKVLAVIPIRTLQTVAGLYERQPKAGRFSVLGVAQKLNYIAAVTAVPYRTMKEFSDRPGELGLMMGRGLSVSLGTAR
ncbi:MAG TPA: hypothetical protein DDZ81_02320 [Acetobacteraceae bacterium]|jgi:hypothetical protein|nr:hypothetical protein [Acetobacteraceae bacterium]